MEKSSISFYILIIFFVFSVFSFGGTEKWAVVGCESILIGGVVLSCFLKEDFKIWPKKLSFYATFIVFFIVFSLFQIIPFQIKLLEIVQYERIEEYKKGREAEKILQNDLYRKDPFERIEIPYEKTDLTPQLPSFLTISRTPISTLKAIVSLFSFFCFILLMEDVLKDRKKYRILLLLIGMVGLIVALIELIEKGEENKTHILWIRESSRAKDAFGPFVNENHGACFINLTFPLLYYFLWKKIVSSKRITNKIGKGVLLVSLLCLHSSIILSSSSRGNVLFLIVLPVFFLIGFGFQLKNKKMLISGFLIGFLELFFLCFLIREGFLTSQPRVDMNLNVIKEISFLGNGINSFEETFPAKIKTWPLYHPMRNIYLENEYLQALYEGGLILFFGIVIMAIFILSNLFKNLFFKKNYFWLVIPIFSEMVRSSFDMTFHIFPLAATFFVLVTTFYFDGEL